MILEQGYRFPGNKARVRRRHRRQIILTVLILVVVGIVGYKLFAPTSVEKAISRLQFDASVSQTEKQTITKSIREQAKTYKGSTDVSVQTALEQTNNSLVFSAYVPITNVYGTRQTVTKTELGELPVRFSADIDATARAAMIKLFGLSESDVSTFDSSKDELADTDIAFVPASQLSFNVKLLKLDGAYYLDDFNKGAVFRSAAFTGDAAKSLSTLQLNSLPSKNEIFTVNQTGVTALTRVMMRMLNSNNDPTYFSKNIGGFLAAADLTHISNEVSFKEGCTYHNAVFCSDPRFIETLKASGVDLVELTGNHNNDVGSEYNTETINLYHSLGWHTFGGGLNAAEAAKPYVANQKQSKVAFLGYNYPDSPNGGAIAGSSKAGANSFDYDKIQTAIEAAKQQANFVIVDVQFWECYAYPDGYVELPACYAPIPDQAEVFQKIIDLGADMVVGSSAHQPQTYELYKGKPIYYGLGNLYFDQTSWPGTEKGIVLTHYFQKGTLLQTKLSPTVYHDELQTRLMDDEEAVDLLEKLQDAR